MPTEYPQYQQSTHSKCIHQPPVCDRRCQAASELNTSCHDATRISCRTQISHVARKSPILHANIRHGIFAQRGMLHVSLLCAPSTDRCVRSCCMLRLCCSNYDWKSDQNLWRVTVVQTPGNTKALHNWGRSLSDLNRTEECLDHYRRSVCCDTCALRAYCCGSAPDRLSYGSVRLPASRRGHVRSARVSEPIRLCCSDGCAVHRTIIVLQRYYCYVAVLRSTPQ